MTQNAPDTNSLIAPCIEVNIGDERYRVDPQPPKFWRKVDAGEWEADTFRVLAKFLRGDSIYVDIGAWIGPTVLFAARRCKMVYCVEPDPVAYRGLLANLRMNDIDNVRTFHGALAAENGCVKISNPSGFGDSTTRIQSTSHGDCAEVLAADFPRLLDWWRVEKIDLLKIDIEGAEFDLIPSLVDLLAHSKPVIHLSLHAPLFAESARREKLGAVIDLANRYRACFDKHLNPISPDDILSAAFSGKFNTVVLTDAAL